MFDFIISHLFTMLTTLVVYFVGLYGGFKLGRHAGIMDAHKTWETMLSQRGNVWKPTPTISRVINPNCSNLGGSCNCTGYERCLYTNRQGEHA